MSPHGKQLRKRYEILRRMPRQRMTGTLKPTPPEKTTTTTTRDRRGQETPHQQRAKIGDLAPRQALRHRATHLAEEANNPLDPLATSEPPARAMRNDSLPSRLPVRSSMRGSRNDASMNYSPSLDHAVNFNNNTISQVRLRVAKS